MGLCSVLEVGSTRRGRPVIGESRPQVDTCDEVEDSNVYKEHP
jgi:hypothetical protein